MRTSLAFILACTRRCSTSRLCATGRSSSGSRPARRGPVDDDEETYCSACDAKIGIFYAHGDAWLHYTGEGTAASPVELFDAGHEPVIAWRPAGAR